MPPELTPLLLYSRNELNNKIQNYLVRVDYSKLSDKKVLLACSGGVDSLALLIISYVSNINFSVAYIEHNLNPETKDAAIYLRELCAEINVEYSMSEITLEDFQKKSNVESHARRLRYESLEQIRIKEKADVIATAHHSDDVAETILINLIRGSGSGLSSLAPSRNYLIRPLLGLRKEDLQEIVKISGLVPIEDPSNKESVYVRNRIRHEVIPLLNDIANRDTVPLLAAAARHLREDKIFIESLATSLWPNEEPTTKSLRLLDPVLQRHALRSWIEGYPPSNEEMDRIMRVVNHEIEGTQISGMRTIRRSKGILYQDTTTSSEKKEDK